MQKGYLGIDESNHGRIPEFFVGAFSTIPSHVIKSSSMLSKKLNRAGIEGVVYKHLKFEADVIERVGHERLIPIALGEFARFFQEVAPLELVIIDGTYRSSMMDVFGMLLHKVNRSTRLICEKDGDRWYPLVNEADRVARRFYRDFQQRIDTMRWCESRLLFNMSDYERYLASL